MNSRADRPDPERPALWEWLGWAVIVGLAATILLGGCSPRIVEHIRYQHDTTYVERIRVDSVVRRDSVYIRERGDTVYIYREQVRDRWRLVHDTIDRVRVDSVAVECTKVVEVEKPLSAWKRAKMAAFWWLLAGVVVLLAWTFRKPLLKLIGYERIS